jgi:hypothetical protein
MGQGGVVAVVPVGVPIGLLGQEPAHMPEILDPLAKIPALDDDHA